MAYTKGQRFEWDGAKDSANQRKHGVSFEQAKGVFSTGVERLEIFDEAHSHEEERFIAIGPIEGGIVVVVWTESEDGVIRIISARWATRQERRRYREAMERQQ